MKALPFAIFGLSAVLVLAPAVHAQQHEAKPKTKAKAQTKREPEPDEIHARIIDHTAYTLEGGRLRLGVFKIQFGLLDFATIGTYTLPWAVLAATFHAKLRLLQAGPFAVGVQAGIGYFDSTRLRWADSSIGNAVVVAVPLEAFGSFRATDSFDLSFGVAYTEVSVDGALSVEAFEGAGRGAADNFQLTASNEIRLSGLFALVIELRWLVLQRAAANAEATLYPDMFTTVVVHSGGSASDFEVRDAFSIVPSLLMTVGVFNVRLGVGYGNFNVPLINFVLPERSLIPEADLFFLF